MMGQQQKLDSLFSIMLNDWQRHGRPLTDIFADLEVAYGTVNARVVFASFCAKNKSNAKFMTEFNRSCFT